MVSKEERKQQAARKRQEQRDRAWWINHFRRALWGKGEQTVKAGSR